MAMMHPTNVRTVLAAAHYLKVNIVNVHGDGNCLIWALLHNEQFCRLVGVEFDAMRRVISRAPSPVTRLRSLMQATRHRPALISTMRDVSQLSSDQLSADIQQAVLTSYDIRDNAIIYCTDPDNHQFFTDEDDCWGELDDGTRVYDPTALDDYARLDTYTQCKHLRGIAGFARIHIYVIVKHGMRNDEFEYHCTVSKFDSPGTYETCTLSAMRDALAHSGQDGCPIAIGVYYDHIGTHYQALSPREALPLPFPPMAAERSMRRRLIAEHIDLYTINLIVSNGIHGLDMLCQCTSKELLRLNVAQPVVALLAHARLIDTSGAYSEEDEEGEEEEEEEEEGEEEEEEEEEDEEEEEEDDEEEDEDKNEHDSTSFGFDDEPPNDSCLDGWEDMVGDGDGNRKPAAPASRRPPPPPLPTPTSTTATMQLPTVPPLPFTPPSRSSPGTPPAAPKKRKDPPKPHWSDRKRSTAYVLHHLNKESVTGVACFQDLPFLAFGKHRPRLTGAGLKMRCEKKAELIHPDKHPGEEETYRPAFDKLMREYSVLAAEDASYAVEDNDTDLDIDPDAAALAVERMHGSVEDTKKTTSIIGVTFTVTKRKGKKFPSLTDDDRYRLTGRAVEQVAQYILAHPLELLVEMYSATRERGDENSQLHVQFSSTVRSSGGAKGAHDWVKAFWRAVGRRVVVDVSGERIADFAVHVVVREPQEGETFDEAALDHLMYTMKDVEASKPWANTAKGGHSHGGRRFPNEREYKAAWAAFQARRTDLNSHGLKKRHFSYTAGAGDGSRRVKNPIKVNTNNFIITTIEWVQREELWELYPSILRMVAWMVEAGSHELQCSIIFGGRGYPLSEARANALNLINIDPRQAADIRIIRLIFCGSNATEAAALENVMYRPSFLADRHIVEDMTYQDAVQWRSTRRFPLRFISWSVPEPIAPRGCALVVDLGAVSDGHSVVAMNELRRQGFVTTAVLNELGDKRDPQAFTSLGVLTLVADVIRMERTAAANSTPSFTGVTVPRALVFTEHAYTQFAETASQNAGTTHAKIAAVSNALNLDRHITDVNAIACGVQDWSTFTTTLETAEPGLFMAVVSEPEREHHYAVAFCISHAAPFSSL